MWNIFGPRLHHALIQTHCMELYAPQLSKPTACALGASAPFKGQWHRQLETGGGAPNPQLCAPLIVYPLVCQCSQLHAPAIVEWYLRNLTQTPTTANPSKQDAKCQAWQDVQFLGSRIKFLRPHCTIKLISVSILPYLPNSYLLQFFLV